MARQTLILTLMLSGCMYTSGCVDRVRITRQTYHVNVIDTVTRKPASGTTIELKFDRPRWDLESPESKARPPVSKEMQQQANEFQKERNAYWDKLPWESAITNEYGKAAFDVESMAVDPTHGSKPPLTCDGTGSPYFIRIKMDDGKFDVIKIQMIAGKTFSGLKYSVTVVGVDEPRYVKE